MHKRIFLLFLFFSLFNFSKAGTAASDSLECTTIIENSFPKFEERGHRPNHLIKRIKKKYTHSKKVMAAILAFPLPFGILALHRIYLGTKPYVPVVYIATVGGVFGILPFIDFCVLLFDRDIDRFNNNGKIFMWINE
jgi:hypothetical protein